MVTSAEFASPDCFVSEAADGAGVCEESPLEVDEAGALAAGGGAGGGGFCASEAVAARRHALKVKIDQNERLRNRCLASRSIIPHPPPAVRLGQCHQNAGDTDR